ncbi:MAG: acyl-CoA dehydrogenase family protein [Chloroflexota bacterium]|nr:acyl-CoA dehydrogenase family protein [Chloroflexota bacterium]
MDFDFTEDQVMLRGLVREFLTEQTPVAHVRAMMDDERGYSADTYRQFVQLGMLPFPETYGGAGLGMVEQAIILEEMGRIPYPGPYFATVILAGSAIMASGDEKAMARYLPDVCNGDLTMTVAFLEDSIGWGPNEIALTAKKDGDAYVLNGVKRFVPFGHTADVVLVAARSGGGDGAEGVSLIAVPRAAAGLRVEKDGIADLTEKSATLHFENVRVPVENLLGTEGGAWPAVRTMLMHAAVGASAEMLGASRKSLEMSTDYAKVRKQFGQFIGQFQAVKHKLAEMLVLVENSHGAVYYAAWALDADAPDAALAASVAKSFVNNASRKVCGEAIQVHGGIGFTWEYDLHLYFKRAKYFEPLYGDLEEHRERVLQEVLAGHISG